MRFAIAVDDAPLNTINSATLEVLTEGVSLKKDMYYGYSDTNKLINFTGKNIKVGDLVKVEIDTAKTWSLDGHAK